MDEVVRSADSALAARTALMETLDLDEVQGSAVAAMQVMRLASRHQLVSEYEELTAQIAELESRLAR
jgi:DNA gyrase/topoisomerase IV subunit A